MNDLKNLLEHGAEPDRPRTVDAAADLARGRRAVRTRRVTVGAGLMSGLALAVGIGIGLGGARTASPALPAGQTTGGPTTVTAPAVTGPTPTDDVLTQTSPPIESTTSLPVPKPTSDVLTQTPPPIESTTSLPVPRPTAVSAEGTTAPVTGPLVWIEGPGAPRPDVCPGCRVVQWHALDVAAGPYTLRCESDGARSFFTGPVTVRADGTITGESCAIDPAETLNVRIGLVGQDRSVYSEWTRF